MLTLLLPLVRVIVTAARLAHAARAPSQAGGTIWRGDEKTLPNRRARRTWAEQARWAPGLRPAAATSRTAKKMLCLGIRSCYTGASEGVTRDTPLPSLWIRENP